VAKTLKWFAKGLVVIALFALALLAAVAISYAIQSRNNLAQLGPVAPVLAAGEFSFRDLNKNGRLDTYEDARLTPEQRADDLLVQMTLPEKAGMMFITQIASRNGGDLVERPVGGDPFSLLAPTNSKMIANKLMNHFNVVFVDEPGLFATWQNKLQTLAERTRLGIPVTLASDPRHGSGSNPAASLPAEHFSLWPEPLGFAATRDPALVSAFGEIANKEYRAVGIRLALHPMADLATEPRWARAAGTFGEDAQLSAQMVAAYVRGFQGESLGSESVATMVKHFSGAGPQEGGRDAHFPHGKNQVYPGDQFDYHLMPFVEGALPANAAQIMPYYGIPVGQTGEDVGFAFNRELTAWGVEHLDVDERILKLLDAGIDQFGGEYIPETLVALVEQGRLDEERLDISVHRLLLDKFRLGLFDNPYVNVKLAQEAVGSKEARAAGESAQRRSLVLLKNDPGSTGEPTLPIAQQDGTRKKLYLENIDPALVLPLAEVVSTPEEADLAIIRVAAPFYAGDGIMERSFHSGDLDFKGAEKARLLALMKTVPTILDIYLDRAAVVPEIAEHSAEFYGCG